MSVALRGNLEDFGIAEVFQLVGQQRKTGILEFTGTDGRQVQLRFDRGAVVSAAPAESKAHESLGDMLVRCGCLTRAQVDGLHAECEPSGQSLPRVAIARNLIAEGEIEQIEDLLTRETIFEVLRWSDGSFDFHARQVFHSRAIETLLGAEQILMDGLRMVDEWQMFADLVPSENTVFERTGRFETYRDQMNAVTGRRFDQAQRVFALVDGRLRARRIIDLSRLGSFDATRALADLHAAGVIVPRDPESLQRSRRRSRPKVLPRADARSWVATLVPLLLLGLVTAAIHWRNTTSPTPGVFPIPASPLALVHDDYATLRVSHALEAYRFGVGHWPRTLAQLSVRGILTPDRLASEQGRPYYYVERAEGAVLLAPER
jgi:hypothetical protein